MIYVFFPEGSTFGLHEERNDKKRKSDFPNIMPGVIGWSMTPVHTSIYSISMPFLGLCHEQLAENRGIISGMDVQVWPIGHIASYS